MDRWRISTKNQNLIIRYQLPIHYRWPFIIHHSSFIIHYPSGDPSWLLDWESASLQKMSFIVVYRPGMSHLPAQILSGQNVVIRIATVMTKFWLNNSKCRMSCFHAGEQGDFACPLFLVIPFCRVLECFGFSLPALTAPACRTSCFSCLARF